MKKRILKGHHVVLYVPHPSLLKITKNQARFVLTQRTRRPRRSLRKRKAASLVLAITKEASLLERCAMALHV